MCRDDAHALDMLQAAREIAALSAGASKADFQQSRMMQHAMMRLIQIIGEAARKTSPEYRSAHSDIPWPKIIGMRHRLVHDYFGINLDLVWEVIAKDIPELLVALEKYVPGDQDAQSDRE